MRTQTVIECFHLNRFSITENAISDLGCQRYIRRPWRTIKGRGHQRNGAGLFDNQFYFSEVSATGYFFLIQKKRNWVIILQKHK